MAGQFERMRVYLTVAEQKSFAGAARKLHLSPTIVTRYVSELERDLGAQLLVRTTRRVSLTRAGDEYAVSAKVILEEGRGSERAR